MAQYMNYGTLRRETAMVEGNYITASFELFCSIVVRFTVYGRIYDANHFVRYVKEIKKRGREDEIWDESRTIMFQQNDGTKGGVYARLFSCIMNAVND